MKCNISKTANLCIWVIINSTKLLICSYSSEMKIYAWCNVPAKCFKFCYIFGIRKPTVVVVYFVINNYTFLTNCFHQPNFEIFRWAISSSTNIFFPEEYDMQLLCKLHRLKQNCKLQPPNYFCKWFLCSDYYFF